MEENVLGKKPKIKLLIVDDSLIVRKLLREMASSEPDIEVVGTAMDPYEAKKKIAELKPDVITLDIEMPRMDGLTFLKILMQRTPMPVIVISSLSQRGSKIALDALEAGAFDVLGKPDGSRSVDGLKPQLLSRVRAAFQSTRRKQMTTTSSIARRSVLESMGSRVSHPRSIVLVGSSTGGTEALRRILLRLPEKIPPICVVQHIAPYFSKNFADRLNEQCPFEVKEAENGDIAKPGRVLIAPGDFHMVLHKEGANYKVRLSKGPPVWHQRPAADVLFKSAAEFACKQMVGVILTGMGQDGAEGLLSLKNKGVYTIGQNKETCVVYGMPQAAMKAGAVCKELPLNQIADAIMDAIEGKENASSHTATV